MLDIHKLPEGYPDELFFSLMARYHKYSGNARPETSMEELCGPKEGNGTVKGLGVMQYLNSHPTEERSLDFFLANHTLIPYVCRYYSKKKKIELHDKLVSLKVGKVYGSSVSQKPRYCPLCSLEDMKRYGEMYWHRIHQITAVNYCPIHDCAIETVHNSPRYSVNLFAHAGICNSKPRKNFTELDVKLEPYLREALFADFSFYKDKNIGIFRDVFLEKYAYVYGKRMGIGERIIPDVFREYGEDFCSKFFSLTNTGSVIKALFSPGMYRKAEPALILALYLDIPPETLFVGRSYC